MGETPEGLFLSLPDAVGPPVQHALTMKTDVRQTNLLEKVSVTHLIFQEGVVFLDRQNVDFPNRSVRYTQTRGSVDYSPP